MTAVTHPLETDRLTKTFYVRSAVPFRRRPLTAVNDVTLCVDHGQTLGVVGESGCGKSTFGRLVVGDLMPSAGTVSLGGRPVSGIPRRERARRVQPIVQDPRAALDPRWRVGALLAEPLEIHGWRTHRAERVGEALSAVRLPPDIASRFPHQISGGQAQRVAIARALMSRPRLLVCDEALSALDIAVQVNIARLLQSIQRRDGTSIVFISHDLHLVRHLSHRIAIMYLGRVVEVGPVDAVGSSLSHPYTRALIGAAPRIDPRQRRAKRATLDGETPSPLDPPPGCVFQTRCPIAVGRCRLQPPPPVAVGQRHEVHCHLAEPLAHAPPIRAAIGG